MKTNGRYGFNYVVTCVLLTLVVVTVFYPYFQLPWQRNVLFAAEPKKPHQLKSSPRIAALYDKWIVITSISHPTADIQYLATLPDWKVLVVGDVKTPKNWRYPNITFLSIEDQKNLNYRISSLLPESSYSRKNVGYLYAIAHGAQVIYDTDDDNRPTGRMLEGFDLGAVSRGLVYSNSNMSLFVNPYRHFTQLDIWPRGFPLEAISQPYDATCRLCSNGYAITPTIQQGLVNKDPDVDAIFRLTRLKAGEIPNILFDSAAPPLILSKGVFAPFNSQNTLFHKKALWAMVLPITTTFRVCDIWRGYWAQALLWLTGGHLGFYPPNARQTRNPHSYLQDFREEIDMYDDAGRLAKFLSEWHCSRYKFFECVRELTWQMVNLKFWKDKDAILIESWLNDLVDIGYKEPSMEVQVNNTPCEENSSLIFSVFNPPYLKSKLKLQSANFNGIVKISSRSVKNVTSVNRKYVVASVSQKKNVSALSNVVRRIDTPKPSVFNNTLLVIVFNFPYFENIPLLETMYNTSFLHILYCGFVSEGAANNRIISEFLPKVTLVNSTNTNGYFGYECLLRAVAMGYKVNGYLVMCDDVLLNSWNLVHLNQSRIWYNEPHNFGEISLNHTGPHPWTWWNVDMGQEAVNASLSELMLLSSTTKPKMNFSDYYSNLQKNVKNESSIPFSYSDIYYVPQHLADTLYEIGSVFRRNRVFVEIAVPMLLCGLSSKNEWELLLGRYLTYPERTMNVRWYNSSSYFLHPFKLSQIAQNINLTLQLQQYFGNLSASTVTVH